MNMANPNNDPRTDEPTMTLNPPVVILHTYY